MKRINQKLSDIMKVWIFMKYREEYYMRDVEIVLKKVSNIS